jgi:hypothetical protein
MKLKTTNKAQLADQTSPNEKLKMPLRPSWEMSAQAALRVDYLTNFRSL